MKLPEGMPTPAAEYLQTCLAGSDPKGQERLRRLLSAPGMEKIWKTLIRLNPDYLIGFIYQAACSPLLIYGNRALPGVSPAKERQRINKVLKAAQTLRNNLEELGQASGKVNALPNGIWILRAAAERAEQNAFAKGEYRQLTNLFMVRQYARSIDMHRALTVLLSVAAIAASAPRAPGPRKLKDARSLRTAYVQDLAAFMKKRFGKPLYEEVATVANLMFDEPDHPLTSNHVQRLVEPQKKISRRKSQ